MKKVIIYFSFWLSLACQNTQSPSQHKEPVSNQNFEDQLEDAVFFPQYIPATMYENQMYYSTTALMIYEIKLMPAVDSQGNFIEPQNEKIPLDILIKFSYSSLKNNYYYRKLNFENTVRLYTKSKISDFDDCPENLDNQLIFLGKDTSTAMAVGKFHFNKDNKELQLALCENEFEKMCKSTLNLRIPQKGSQLEQKFLNLPKRNYLNYFPYKVDFNIKLLDDSSEALTGKYDIRTEFNFATTSHY